VVNLVNSQKRGVAGLGELGERQGGRGELILTGKYHRTVSGSNPEYPIQVSPVENSRKRTKYRKSHVCFVCLIFGLPLGDGRLPFYESQCGARLVRAWICLAGMKTCSGAPSAHANFSANLVTLAVSV
jgi:hypothetical protein